MKPRTQISIRPILQRDFVAHLAVAKGIARDKVQGISVGQLRGSQHGELLWGRMQFQFGTQRQLHRTSVPYSHQKINSMFLLKDSPYPQPQTRNAAFLPKARSQGHPAAGSVKVT